MAAGSPAFPSLPGTPPGTLRDVAVSWLALHTQRRGTPLHRGRGDEHPHTLTCLPRANPLGVYLLVHSAGRLLLWLNFLFSEAKQRAPLGFSGSKLRWCQALRKMSHSPSTPAPFAPLVSMSFPYHNAPARPTAACSLSPTCCL